MDACKHCGEYHHESSVCDEYIESLEDVKMTNKPEQQNPNDEWFGPAIRKERSMYFGLINNDPNDASCSDSPAEVYNQGADDARKLMQEHYEGEYSARGCPKCICDPMLRCIKEVLDDKNVNTVDAIRSKVKSFLEKSKTE